MATRTAASVSASRRLRVPASRPVLYLVALVLALGCMGLLVLVALGSDWQGLRSEVGILPWVSLGVIAAAVVITFWDQEARFSLAA